MKDFTQSLGFIVGFLTSVLLLSITLGDGPTTAFLWLVLLSMVIINYQDIIYLMGRFSSV